MTNTSNDFTLFDLLCKIFLIVLEERVCTPEMIAITVVIIVTVVIVIVTITAAHAAVETTLLLLRVVALEADGSCFVCS